MVNQWSIIWRYSTSDDFAKYFISVFQLESGYYSNKSSFPTIKKLMLCRDVYCTIFKMPTPKEETRLNTFRLASTISRSEYQKALPNVSELFNKK